VLATFVYFILPVILLCIGFPIYLILLITSLVAVVFVADVPLTTLQTNIFGGLDNFPLLAIPLFIFAGEVMGRGGLARRLVEWALSIIGGVRGSLALATIASSELFGAMSGSSVGCVAAIGRLMVPELKNRGYSAAFAGSLIASCGSIAVIIPPSIPMIIYGIAAQQSVPKLFLAGIVPGLLIGILISIYLLYYARVNLVPLTAGLRWRNVFWTTLDAFWSLLAPVVILGGIYGGIFTPTEAAGIACVYAILVARYIYRELSWHDIWQTAMDSGVLISQILIIVAAAGAYSWLITVSGFPQKLVEVIAGLSLQTWLILLVINVALLFFGSVLEPPAAILILTPLLVPLMQQAGVDEIHFGIIVTVNLAIGLFMPPFGLNIFATHALFGVPLPQLYRGILPFFVIYLIALALITYIPAITLFPLRFLH
jgi:C4-dicarboxylate transporter, DctM subunit